MAAAQFMGVIAWGIKPNCRDFARQKFTGACAPQRFATRQFPIYALNVIDYALKDIIGREQ
jgi:hypothetical protein